MDDVSDQLKDFLDYVAGKRPDNAYIEKLEHAVDEAKGNRECRHEYMTLHMWDQLYIEKGIEQGTTQMIINALCTTHSVKQTAAILNPKITDNTY